MALEPQPYASGFHSAPTWSSAPAPWPRALPGPMARVGKVRGPAQPGHRGVRATCSPGNGASTISFYFAGTEPKVTRKNNSQRGPPAARGPSAAGLYCKQGWSPSGSWCSLTEKEKLGQSFFFFLPATLHCLPTEHFFSYNRCQKIASGYLGRNIPKPGQGGLEPGSRGQGAAACRSPAAWGRLAGTARLQEVGVSRKPGWAW